ncbi:MAG: hypothetical protein GX808_09320 [Syntrophomonadaceae bacterium]|jgi:hypothetical protein|nr:hypothetical protein [Syntrophomonadaceae bacterium]
MTNFLPAGIINDSIEDIFEKVLELKKIAEENDREKLLKGLNELENIALDLWAFIDQFPCQPIIYTGQGKTEELINRLEWALTLTDENDLIAIEQRLKSGGNGK